MVVVVPADPEQAVTSSTTNHDNDSSVPAKNKNHGCCLQWSRIYKTVNLDRNKTKSSSSSNHDDNNNNNDSSTLFFKRRRSTLLLQRRRNDANTNQKEILNHVSGFAVPGEVLAVMGPSGSGKTSLLNVLAGRASYQQGKVSYPGLLSSNDDDDDNNNNNTKQKRRLLAKIAYVRQEDIFFEHLTVKDQLTYTALLRIQVPANNDNNKNNNTMSDREYKLAQVDRILSLLRLEKVADTEIGDVSGGEKKRVNIGTEMLTSPSMMILDEPTSGLDSTTSVALLEMLQAFAAAAGESGNNTNNNQNNPPKIVITSIHQPSSAVFRNFDRLVMLSEGKVVFFGKPAHSLQYLQSLHLTCPDGYNAADHWMDLLVLQQQQQQHHQQQSQKDIDQLTEAAAAAADSSTQFKSPRLILEQAWNDEHVAQQMDDDNLAFVQQKSNEHNNLNNNNNNNNNNNPIDNDTPVQPNCTPTTTIASTSEDAATSFLSLNHDHHHHHHHSSSKYNTTWWVQYKILTHRAMKNSRSAIFTPLNLAKSLAIGIVAGLVWFQMDYTEQNVNDIRSYYFFTMLFWVFDAMFTALTCFPDERDVILKERASGSYHLSAYFLAKTTADGPVRLILPLIYMFASFWMAGINNNVQVFLGTTGCTLLSVLAGESIGLFFGAAIYDMQRAITAMTVFVLFLMLLGGFFIENVPDFLEWGKFISPFKYAFDSSLQLVFDKDVPCDGSGALQELCSGTNSVVSAHDVLEFCRVQGTVAFNVGMLVVVIIIPRYLAYLALLRKKAGER